MRDIQRLKSGDIIKLGVATNAPKIRFLVDDEQAVQETANLSEIMSSLQRGKTYRVGNGEDCRIRIPDASISGAVAEIKVPARKDSLWVTKIGEPEVKIAIDGVELTDDPRTLAMHQTLQIGDFYALVHDQPNLISSRVPKRLLFSEVVALPRRGDIYAIGSAGHCVFRIDEADVPRMVAEIVVPVEGEYFVVKKIGNASITVTIDGQEISANPRAQCRYEVNQMLAIGDYLTIRNNHRALPPTVSSFGWKKLAGSILFFILLALFCVGAGYIVKKYWGHFNLIMSTQKLMQKYQKMFLYYGL